MVARVVRIENKKLPMKDATKGMQVIGLGDGAVSRTPCQSLALWHGVLLTDLQAASGAHKM